MQRSLDHLKRCKFGNIVSVIVCNDTNGFNENSDMHTLTGGDTPPEWSILGQIEEFSHKSETEDDAVTYFAVKTETIAEDKNTKVKTDTLTAKVIEYSELLWKLKYRITEKLEKGKFVRMFNTAEPTLRVWLMVEKYNGDEEKLCTQYVYGKLRISSEDNENMKLVRPTLELQTIPSEYTGIVPEAGMLGVTASTSE